MDINVKSNVPVEGQGTNFLSNQNAQWAQGMVLAMLARLCPKFADYQNELMKNEVNYMKATLRAAVSQGYSQLASGTAEGAMGATTAAGSGFGVYKGVSIMNESASLYDEYNGTPVFDEYTGELKSGKITQAIDALKASEPTAPKAIFNNEGGVTGRGTEIEMNQVQTRPDGEVVLDADGNPVRVGGEGNDPERPVDSKATRVAQKRKLEALQREYQHHVHELELQGQQLMSITNAVSNIGQFVGKPVQSGFELNQTIMRAQEGIYSSGSQNLEQMKGSTVSTFKEIVDGAQGVFSANAALAARV
jgi:hypothetical protein